MMKASIDQDLAKDPNGGKGRKKTVQVSRQEHKVQHKTVYLRKEYIWVHMFANPEIMAWILSLLETFGREASSIIMFCWNMLACETAEAFEYIYCKSQIFTVCNQYFVICLNILITNVDIVLEPWTLPPL